MPGKGTSLQRGHKAESIAAEYLQQQGLKLIERNYRCRQGEIDLIMQHQQSLVFVEVRQRSNPRFGGALESIDYFKQQRLLYAAQHYLQRHPKAGQLACRFDVIAFGELSDHKKIQWLKDAFQA